MKKADIAMIVLAGSVSVLVSFFVMKSFLGNPNNETAKIKTFETISSEVEPPNNRIFNSSAINPTVEVYVQGQSKSETRAVSSEKNIKEENNKENKEKK